MVRIGTSPVHGTGVFATRDLPAGTLVERAPVLVVPGEDGDLLADTALSGYLWGWGDEGDLAIALGTVTLVNHSYEPNCRYEHDVDEGVVLLHTRRAVAADEELTINYNGDPSDDGPLWFDVSE